MTGKTEQNMGRQWSASRLPAVFCAMLLPLCALFIRPVAETGICDDWSYIRSAQVLAQTGHIAYNGWAAPMLGCQLYLGALFIKIFGFSFTAVRCTNLLVAIVLVYVLQRIFVRAGVSAANAVLGTSALALSPMFLTLAFSFMTDVCGLFGMVICLYGCLRALQATTANRASAWICFAALSSTIAGTARQTAWLGVLVMVPSTLWLLRSHRRVIVIGAIAYGVGLWAVFASMHWFKQQPYAMIDSRTISLKADALVSIFCVLLPNSLMFCFFLGPVLLAFLASKYRRVSRLLGVLLASVAISFVVVKLAAHSNNLKRQPLPFTYNSVTPKGLIDSQGGIIGSRPIVIPSDVRFALLVLSIAGFLGLVWVLLDRRNAESATVPEEPKPQLSWMALTILLLPFTLGYVVFLMPRVMTAFVFDRYFLPFMPLALLVLFRLYQERVSPRPSMVAAVLIATMGLFGIAGMHDVFSMYRGILAACNEVRATGVPRTEINGGWEYNSWTQMQTLGYINDRAIRVPANAYLPDQWTQIDCGYPVKTDQFTVLHHLRYAVSFIPSGCAGPSNFAPITYHSWLAPHTTTLYIVKY